MRHKNANRQHLIADITDPLVEPTTWLPLEKYIQTAEPADNESTVEEGFYDGDGNPETNIESLAVGWTFTGYRDLEDAAQNLIVSKYLTPHDRDIWHKIISADGKEETVGIATLSGITPGGGDATVYEAFAATATYKGLPTVREAELPGG